MTAGDTVAGKKKIVRKMAGPGTPSYRSAATTSGRNVQIGKPSSRIAWFRRICWNDAERSSAEKLSKPTHALG